MVLSLSFFIYFQAKTVSVDNLIDFSFDEMEFAISKGESNSILAWRSKRVKNHAVINKAKAILLGGFHPFYLRSFGGVSPILSVFLFKNGTEFPHCGVLSVFHRDGTLFFNVNAKTEKGRSSPLVSDCFALGELKSFFQELIQEEFIPASFSAGADREICQSRIRLFQESK